MNDRDDIAGLATYHQFRLVNHSSIGPEDHCGCGFRPRGWLAWSLHFADVLIAAGATMPAQRCIRVRLAAVIGAHWYNDWGVNDADMCACGECPPNGPDDDGQGSKWAEHVADAVIRELQLTEDGGVIVGCAHE